MKESRYNPLQVTSLLAVLVLQVFWVGNAYVQRAQKLGMVCDNVLKQAVDSSGNSTSLGRLHNEVGRLLDRERVDCAYVLLQFDLTHNTIVGQSRDVGIPPVGAVMSGGYPFQTHPQAVMLVLTNAYASILGSMWLLMVATLLVCGLLILSILEQIKVIERQKAMEDLRNDFSYAMVHNMKSPLSTIIMGTHFLQSGKMDNKAAMRKKYLDVIGDEAEHLLSLVNRLLTISKLENKELALNKTDVDVQAMLENIAEKAGSATEKPFCFELQEGGRHVVADAEYLHEVLENLVENAVKYSKDSIRITASAQSKEKWCIIKIHDEGIGISKDELPYIFDKFKRAPVHEQARSGVKGFGIALHFVSLVMKAHGGKISVRSEEGKFTEFILYLPKKSKNDKTTAC